MLNYLDVLMIIYYFIQPIINVEGQALKWNAQFVKKKSAIFVGIIFYHIKERIFLLN